MRRILLLMFCASLCLTALAGCKTTAAQTSGSVPPASESEPEPEPPSEPTPPPTLTPTPAPSAVPEPAPTPEPYWFGQAVAESDPVEESWFADAVFLGDSRTEGLQIYSGLRTGDFFWYRGMTVFRADDPEWRKVEVDGEALTLMEALARKSYAKVYIMIGINELGYSASSYDKGLREVVDRVKEIQPGAVIYLQTLPPVNEKVAADNGLGSYIKNANVNAFNNVIAQVAWDKQVALLDVASVFRTGQGDLAEDMAVDGVHFRRTGYELWYDYLKSHTLDPAAYAAGQPLTELPEETWAPVPVESPSQVPVEPASPEPAELATPEPNTEPPSTERVEPSALQPEDPADETKPTDTAAAP